MEEEKERAKEIAREIDTEKLKSKKNYDDSDDMDSIKVECQSDDNQQYENNVDEDDELMT